MGPLRAAIVTSCTAELAHARMSAAGIAAPDVAITVDQLARGKPDPEGVLLAAHRLGVEPGNSPADIRFETVPDGIRLSIE